MVSGVLLHWLITAFVPVDAPIVFGLDDHLKRRRGAKIAVQGSYRDVVRSSKALFVKTSVCPEGTQLGVYEYDAAGTHSVGAMHAGFALPDGTGAFGTLL